MSRHDRSRTSLGFEGRISFSVLRLCHIGVGVLVLWRADDLGVPGWWFWEAADRLPLHALACAAYGFLGLLSIAGRGGIWPLVLLAIVNVPVNSMTATMNLGPLVLQMALSFWR